MAALSAPVPCTQLRDAVGHCVSPLAPFQGDGTSTLSLRVGEQLLLLAVQEDGWAHGRLPSGREGFFPAEYVKPPPWTMRTVVHAAASSGGLDARPSPPPPPQQQQRQQQQQQPQQEKQRAPRPAPLQQRADPAAQRALQSQLQGNLAANIALGRRLLAQVPSQLLCRKRPPEGR